MPFILRRLLFYVVAAWVALTVNFFIPRAMPGNAVQAIMAKFPNLQPSAYHALEALLGVGHPGSLWHQYWSYLGNVAHLNFGTSIVTGTSVASDLGNRLPATLELIVLSLGLALILIALVFLFRRGGPLPRAAHPGGGAVSELTRLDAAELARRVQAREVSSVEVTRAHLDRIETVERTGLNAFLHVAADQALAAAAAVDAEIGRAHV